jgi:AcrR family transcriptional regulator
MTTVDALQVAAGQEYPPSHTRVKVLRAAIELFAERGFEATTMRNLAEAADVRAPALYNHFASKEAILLEAVEWALESFMISVMPDRQSMVDGGGDRGGSDPEAELEGVVRRHVGEQVAKSSRVRAYRMLLDNHSVAGYLPPGVRRRLRESRRGYVEAVAALIARTRAAHAVGNASSAGAAPVATPTPMIAALLVTSVCEQVHTWYRPTGPLSADEVADQVWEASRRIIGLP